MARAHRASDDIYNARRRLQRQAAKLERDAAKMKNAALRDAAVSYAQSLRDIAASARGRKYAAEYRALSEKEREAKLKPLAKAYKRTMDAAYARDAIARANAIFAQQINAAGTEGGQSTINKNVAKAFWVANKGLWTTGEHVPRNERYARILAHWYGDSEDARKLEEWLVKQAEEKKGDKLTKQERERLLAESQGSLQLVEEYIAYDLQQRESDLVTAPELDYGRVKKSVYVAH